jgi:hypothetical protein
MIRIDINIYWLNYIVKTVILLTTYGLTSNQPFEEHTNLLFL